MTRQTFYLVLGFLAVFVLISLAPSLPDLADRLEDPAFIDQLGDILLFVAAAICLIVPAIVVSRRLKGPRRSKRARTPSAGSDLASRIRQAARRGERIPALARRFNLSQDAIRAAIGRGGSAQPVLIRRSGSAPAALPGTSFRARQPTLPAQPVRKQLPGRRSPYLATA